MTAQILDVSPHQYHRLPHFSATLAKILIDKSELHARDVWARNVERIAAEDDGDEDADEEEISDDKRKRLELGSVQHALVLGIGKRIEVIPASKLSSNGAYGTKEAKALRDAARARGDIPVKEPDMDGHQRTADTIRERLAAIGHDLTGTSELAIAWSEDTPHGPVECRAMLDHVRGWVPRAAPGEVVELASARAAIIYDLKIVGDASPDRCTRTAESMGYAIQRAAYTRALNALLPELQGRIEFRFLFCEARRPFAVWDPEPDGAFAEVGERRWRRAVKAWAEGCATGVWPGYRRPGNERLSLPSWVLRDEGYTDNEI